MHMLRYTCVCTHTQRPGSEKLKTNNHLEVVKLNVFMKTQWTHFIHWNYSDFVTTINNNCWYFAYIYCLKHSRWRATNKINNSHILNAYIIIPFVLRTIWCRYVIATTLQKKLRMRPLPKATQSLKWWIQKLNSNFFWFQSSHNTVSSLYKIFAIHSSTVVLP